MDPFGGLHSPGVPRSGWDYRSGTLGSDPRSGIRDPGTLLRHMSYGWRRVEGVFGTRGVG